MAMEFEGYFNKQAPDYKAFRPDYPNALYEALADRLDRRERAWDAGCGSGQSTVKLADWFQEVTGTDISEEQISHAPTVANVDYHVGPAERAPLPDGSVDLISSAQAAHWFNLEEFYNEAKRVARPDGSSRIALWTYNLPSVNEDVDDVLTGYYKRTVGAFWPKQRRLVEKNYADLLFPFENKETLTFTMTKEWSVTQYLGFLHTWSATQLYKEKKQEDPVEKIRMELLKAWKWVDKNQTVSWPITCLVGKIG